MAPYPENIFADPVEGEIQLSGTFGELRANHFHAGIDIKGYIGKPLFAAAEGFVSRVKVEEGGYGKALYIQHPNGFTTVYAHLNRFTPEIEAWIKQQQYRRKTFEVDLRPPPGRFTFDRAQPIGQMGTTGYSFGPHLHFEVRRSDTQRPTNPLFFGVKVRDDIPPMFRELKVYVLDERKNVLSEQKINVFKTPRGFRVVGDTVYVPGSRVGFGLKAYDQMNGIPNRNGLFQLSLYQEEELQYRMEMESFSFVETRYLNAHLDYAEKTLHRSNYYRAYIQPGNKASIYLELGKDGTISLAEGQTRQINLAGKDFNGNRSVLSFWVKKKGEIPEAGNYEVTLPISDRLCKTESGFEACFPKGSFYTDVNIPLILEKNDSLSPYSPQVSLGDVSIPVHRYFSVRLPVTQLPAEQKGKACIAYQGERGSLVNIGGEWDNGHLVSRHRAFGTFRVALDDEAPEIEPLGFKADMKNADQLRFLLRDNFPTSGRARGLRYRGWIDGEWVLFGYDAKNSLLWHDFSDGKVGPGTHSLRLEVRDDRNNLAVWEGEFTR